MSDANLGRPIEAFDGSPSDPASSVIVTGTFHGFGLDVMYDDKGMFQVQVAIIEDLKGCLGVYLVSQCKFISCH